MVSQDLDRKSKRVLEAIYQYGGEAEMSEIKEYTGIEKNGIILYRLNEKLGPKGLVETRKVDQGDGNLGVTVASLTESGTNAVGSVLDDGEMGPTLSEQMNMLRSEVENLREEVHLFDGRTDAVENKLENVIDRLEDYSELAEATERAEEAAESAREVVKSHEEVVEQNRELRKRLTEMEDMGVLLTEADLLQGAAVGDGYVHGTALSQIRVLSESGVFGRLVESENVSAYFGTDDDQEPEEVDGVQVPEVPSERDQE